MDNEISDGFVKILKGQSSHLVKNPAVWKTEKKNIKTLLCGKDFWTGVQGKYDLDPETSKKYISPYPVCILILSLKWKQLLMLPKH